MLNVLAIGADAPPATLGHDASTLNSSGQTTTMRVVSLVVANEAMEQLVKTQTCSFITFVNRFKLIDFQKGSLSSTLALCAFGGTIVVTPFRPRD